MCYNIHWCLLPPPPPHSKAPSLARLLYHNPRFSQLNSYSGLSPRPLPCLCSNFVSPCWWELLDSFLFSESSTLPHGCCVHPYTINALKCCLNSGMKSKVACILCWMSYSASLKGYSAAVCVSFLITQVFLTSSNLEFGGLARQAFSLAAGTGTLSSSSSFSGESGAGKTESTKLILKFLSAMSQHSLELSCREKTSCVEQAILESRY